MRLPTSSSNMREIPRLRTRGKAEKSDSLEAQNSAQPSLGWAFGYVFKEAYRAFSDTFREQLRPYGITLGQWYFLRELWNEEGLSQRELSQRVGVSEPTTGTALDVMERRKLIFRRRKKGDHRSQFIHLTPRGRSLRNEVLALAIQVNERAIRGLSTKEVSALRSKIFKMINNLETARRPRDYVK
jgi:DNA-binding MarR family transcriptional regulator